MNFRREKRVAPDVNLISLVDVVLLLLIFFMISSSFVVQPGLRVQLPEVSGRSNEEERGRSVIITRDEAIYFEKGRVTLEELRMLLQRVDSKELLIVRADRDARHGIVVQVMDAAKRAGYAKLAIATSPREEP
jgi:biopolymer transport protein ExbD